jgi:Putative beta-barrel porin 2
MSEWSGQKISQNKVSRLNFMNKLFVSIGLVAAGTVGLQAEYAPDLNTPMQTSKIWSVSASLRGFYDDNYNTAPSGSPNDRGSYGFEVSPSLSLNVPLQQTELGARYVYGLYYYQDRDHLGQNPVDQTHQLDLWVDHAFTERWQTKLEDTFIVSQEPQLTSSGDPYPYRTKGNNIQNVANISLHTDWTRLLSTDLGYRNSFYDYENSGGNASDPSLAGLLNRDENLVSLNFNWQVQPETKAFIGYQFGQVSYTGNEQISAWPSPAFPLVSYDSSDRDNLSHYVYVGVEHRFLQNLSLDVKAGGQYTDEYNAPGGSQTSFNPYADLSVIYTYAEGSYVQAGFTQSQNATDITAPDSSGHIAEYQNSSVLYASVNHRITPKLLGSVIGHWQYSEIKGGAYDGDSDTFYDLGVNLTYNITPHFSAEVGYNFDHLDSGSSDPSYDRNRGYIGVTATY